MLNNITPQCGSVVYNIIYGTFCKVKAFSVNDNIFLSEACAKLCKELFVVSYFHIAQHEIPFCILRKNDDLERAAVKCGATADK